MPTATNYEKERSEVAALLGSGIFNRAPSLAQLLTYICERYFEGEANQIKEYNIAVEALGRPAEFDQKRDSIVRVEAHRLRKRLKDYYETTGASHSLQIQIPSGQYAPRFIPQEPPTALLAPSPPPQIEAFDRHLETIERPRFEYSPAIIGPRRSKAALFVGGALLIGLVGLSLAQSFRLGRSAGLGAATVPTYLVAATGGETVRIAAGSSKGYTDRFGHTWQADNFFQGGNVSSTPEHPIWGTRDPGMYQNRREGVFSYKIPLKPGSHELRLHFAEVMFGETNIAGGGETSRLFTVRANGQPILDGVDIVADAGPSTAHVRVFKDVSPASDGYLHLQFDPVINIPFVNAIEITPGIPGRLRPIRSVSRDHAYTDKKGQLWEPDRFFSGGQLVLRPISVADTSDPEIYRGERFGNLTYGIPVAKGRYSVILHFAETWFGPDKPQGGGSGSRLFDILCNGVALARSFDIYKEAGGGDRAIEKAFHGLEPSAQGKLVISFAPVRNYACINALEVLDESGNQGSW